MINTAPASQTYLFDNQRTGRAKYNLRTHDAPKEVWRFKLRSYPVYSPESTAAFDEDGNLYFGAHDGCFYSITQDGELRWMFRAGLKIYSSPVYSENRVSFHCGDGRLFCLEARSGNFLWVSHPWANFGGSKIYRQALSLFNIFRYDYLWKQRVGMKSWASPLLNSTGHDQVIYSTVRGVGLVAIEYFTGRLIWSRSLGQPWNYLSGPSMDDTGNIYVCSQRRWLNAFSRDGNLLWRTDLKMNLDLWGSPAVDLDSRKIYVTGGLGVSNGGMSAVGLDGKLIWTISIPGAIRGGVALTRTNGLVVATLNGKIMLIDAQSGRLQTMFVNSHASGWLNWTTPSVTPDGCVLVATIEGMEEGALRCFSGQLEPLWEFPVGKSHAVPVVDVGGRVYASSWRGELVCLQT